MSVAGCIAEKYRVVELLGESDLSRVFLAESGGQRFVVRHFRLGHDTALADEIARSVADRAASLYRLRRAGLPRITECLRWEGDTYLIRHYVSEPTLPDIVSRGAPPAESAVRAWGRQLCEAFGVLHQQVPPFAFSGLKPGNVAISRLGKVRILDYPLACFLPDSVQALYAARGYLPRQQVEGEAPSVASDIYNLGQIMAFMLTGVDAEQAPYQRERVAAMRPDVSAEMLDILDRATADDPAARFQAVREMSAALSPEEEKPPPAAPAPVEVPVLTFDPPSLRFDNVTVGERRRAFVWAQSSGRDVRANLSRQEPWLFIQRRAYHAARFKITVEVDTVDFFPGKSYSAVIAVESDAGPYEIRVDVTTAEAPGPLDRMLKVFRRR